MFLDDLFSDLGPSSQSYTANLLCNTENYSDMPKRNVYEITALQQEVQYTNFDFTQRASFQLYFIQTAFLYPTIHCSIATGMLLYKTESACWLCAVLEGRKDMQRLPLNLPGYQRGCMMPAKAMPAKVMSHACDSGPAVTQSVYTPAMPIKFGHTRQQLITH